MILHPSLLLPRPLPKVLEASSPYADPIIMSDLLLASFLDDILTWPFVQGPQDIDLESSTKDSQSSGKSSTADKPPTLDAAKAAPKSSKPPSSSGAQCSHSPTSIPDFTTGTTPDPSVTDMPHHPEPAEQTKMTPLGH
jgi:hypothetical protein